MTPAEQRLRLESVDPHAPLTNLVLPDDPERYRVTMMNAEDEAQKLALYSKKSFEAHRASVNEASGLVPDDEFLEFHHIWEELAVRRAAALRPMFKRDRRLLKQRLREERRVRQANRRKEQRVREERRTEKLHALADPCVAAFKAELAEYQEDLGSIQIGEFMRIAEKYPCLSSSTDAR